MDKKMPSLMEMLEEAGYPREQMYHHRSDLYVFATKLTSGVIDAWCELTGYHREAFVSTFRDNVTGRTMFDIVFQYDPFWEEAHEKGGENNGQQEEDQCAGS